MRDGLKYMEDIWGHGQTLHHFTPQSGGSSSVTSAEVLDPAAVDVKGQLYTAHFVVGSLKEDEEGEDKEHIKTHFYRLTKLF